MMTEGALWRLARCVLSWIFAEVRTLFILVGILKQ
jgi:hypothetical protein